MKAVLKLPRLSMNMVEGTIVTWHRKEGDKVAEGETLYEVETEKVTSEVQCPSDGTLIEILAPEGSEIEVGDPVCRIESS